MTEPAVPQSHPTVALLELSADASAPAQSIVLAPGCWEVRAIQGEDGRSAWSAWGGEVVGCGDQPGDCKTGWITGYFLWSPKLPLITVNTRRYRTVAEAVAHAEPRTFQIPPTDDGCQGPPYWGFCGSLVTAYILDTYHNNVGGLTLQLTYLGPICT